MSHEEDITSVVVTLDNERDCTRAVRALRRQYPTARDMPIFVRAVDEQHRRKLAASAVRFLNICTYICIYTHIIQFTAPPVPHRKRHAHRGA